jgi:mannan endo-1,4-beta-mannosidase
MNSIKNSVLVAGLALTVSTVSFVSTVNAALSNPNADQTAQNTYTYLQNLPSGSSNRVLSGHFAGYSEQTFNMMQTTAVKNLAYDEWPGILAADYKNWSRSDWGGTPSTTYCADQISYGCNSDLIRHWRAGGLVSISVHMPNPAYAYGQYYNVTISDNDFSNLDNHSSTVGARWKDMLDVIAAGLKELQDAGVTVIYRPLHEMNGEWFWWGTTGNNVYSSTRAGYYKDAWIDMYNYFTYTKGLNNLIWVYSPDAKRNYLTQYYPGGSYVDIVGLDAYIDNPTDQMIANAYSYMIGLSKPFAFAEIGPATTNGQFDYGSWASAIRNNYNSTTYFLPWNDVWSPHNNQGTSTLYNDSWSVNRHEVSYSRPSWNSPSVPSGCQTFTDNCSNYNSVYQKSSSLDIDAGNTTYFNGDAARFRRTALSSQYVTYNFSNLNTFSVKVYHQDDNAGASLKFFVSSDNSSWTQIATSATSPVATTSSWYYSYYTPTKYLPSGKNYLKIEWTDGTEYWTPQISELSIYYGITGYSITASAGSNGSITPTSTTASIGSDVTFAISPTYGFEIDQLTDNGSPVSVTNSSYTISNVTANHTISVTLKAAPANLLSNSGFEYDGAATQTPYGWSEWNASAASYTETTNPRTGSYNLAHWSSNSYQVSTYKSLTGLQNGLYTFRAWVRSSGGQNSTIINAKNYGGAERQATIPVSSSYVQVSITDINVTNGTCEISFYSNANAGNWMNADDAEFFLQGSGGAPQCTVTASAGSNGSITPTSSIVNSGSNLTLTISPTSGYAIDTLKVNGTVVTATNNQYTINNITANQTVTVTFKVNSTPTNLFTNPGFEQDGAETQTPSDWSEWNAPAASYTENKGPRSGTYNLAHWSSSAYQVSTYKAFTGLQNGLYTFRAWVKSSGGQNASYMNAKNYGGSELQANIPTTSTYTQISITNINVTNGTCEVSFYSDANGGNWINVDDAEFFKQ